MLKINCSTAPKINLALQQNAAPVIRELSIINDSEEPVVSLTLKLTSEPGFCKPQSWHVDQVGAGEVFHIGNLKVELSPQYLSEVQEAARGLFTVEVIQDDRVLVTEHLEIEILAPNEWGGLGDLPEILAAFCQPNNPAVEKLLKRASEILQRATKDGSLNGYQTGNRRRVAQTIAAIYASIAQQRISYAAPPASFEAQGQKIRLPSQIIESGLATCLDLTMLFAACCEQAGMHPVVVLLKGHAFPGCWLAEEDFSQSVVDDVQAVRKRVDLKELVVIESTLLAQTPVQGFKFARAEAEGRLEDDSDFQLALDVHRARIAKVRPLSTLLPGQAEEPVSGGDEVGVSTPQFGEGLDDIPDFNEEPRVVEEVATDRLTRWQRKLLDLSLRNSLLNFRNTKRVVRIICHDPARFEDLLADGRKFKVQPLPGFMGGGDPRELTLYKQQHGEDAVDNYVRGRLEQNELLVKKTNDDLQASLTLLYRAAREALQEGGANELFVALGFMTWKSGKHGDREIRAPLILLPVELVRKSINTGFRLQSHEDEPVFNPTLLEMLRQDFKMEIPELAGSLPADEHSLDVPLIWQRVRKAVRDIPGWEVREEVVISTFSFAKYLMWKDLVDRVDQLRQSSVVAHLIDSPTATYQSAASASRIPPEQLDEERPPEATFCPMQADSSQLAAIVAAANGEDMVLIGPPGTGKSQTIANLICQCLAEGETVLFVSEKTAALDVVYRRLREVGLGPFCLELHSNRARKSEVLKQLEESWNYKINLDTQEWQREAAKLKTLRDELNLLVRRVHHRHRNGWSAFRATGEVIHNKDVPVVEFDWPSHDTHDEAVYQALESVCTRIEDNLKTIGGVHNHPYFGIEHGDWSPSWQSSLVDAAGRLHIAASRLDDARAMFVEDFKFTLTEPNGSQLVGLVALSELLQSLPSLPVGFIFESQSRENVSDIEQLKTLVTSFQGSWTKLESSYRRSVFDLELGGLLSKYQEAEESWFLSRFLGQRAVLSTLRAHVEGGKRPENPVQDIEVLIDAQKTAQKIYSLKHLAALLGRTWNDVDTDTGILGDILAWIAKWRAVQGLFSTQPELLTNLRVTVHVLERESDTLLAPGSPVLALGAAYEAAHSTFEENLAVLARHIAAPASNLAEERTPGYLERLLEKMSMWQSSATQLFDWCAWRKARAEAIARGLDTLVEAIERGSQGSMGVKTLFRVNYARWFCNRLMDNDEVLRTFVPAEHERRLTDFHHHDARFMELTRKYVRARLAGAIPDDFDIQHDSEWALLRRELQKKRKHKPVREIVSTMPNALATLTPCIMMSPLSIAQYLPADSKPFDVVIFDEASQITTWDAVGAIARGRQAVVVGDPKQLPPTSFFDRRDNEDADADIDVEDMESVLDECISSNLPVMRLHWHYRSRNESLITFSNHRYYNGQLVTFPSPDTDDRSVSYYHVPGGVYEKGGARINRKEAEMIVAEIVKRLKVASFRDTLGVVTFNSQQQSYIEDLLDQARQENPEIERHFDEESIEPVFVKNLESVQGDERDLIFFSITFGPDQAGKVSMNFGPMNQAGGPRRLNVAITRARKALYVYATLRPEQIDLSRTGAEGVRDLKHFLEYAERGPRALAEAVTGSQGGYDSPFEQAVAEALANKGWRTVPQVGVSGYRIDLGVVHPDEEGRFLSAVECDGATYHRSATARDRDLLREQVLRSLGWEVLRVWSLDWWHDAKSATERLHQKLTELLEVDRERRATEEIDDAPDIMDELGETSDSESNDIEVVPPLELSDESEGDQDEFNFQRIARGVTVDSGTSDEEPSGLNSEQEPALDAERLAEPGYRSILRSFILTTINRDGPLRTDVLARVVAKAHGFGRAGARIREVVMRAVPRELPRTREGQLVFLWPEGADPEAWESFRTLPAGETTSVDEMPLQELRVLVDSADLAGRSDEEVIVELAHRLGLRRVGRNVRLRIEVALRSVRP